MKPVSQITLRDAQRLRRKVGTNGKSVSATEQEILDMKKQLEKFYAGTVQMTFAEKICLKNKAY